MPVSESPPILERAEPVAELSTATLHRGSPAEESDRSEAGDRREVQRRRTGFSVFRWVCSVSEWIFGAFSLIVILGLLATVPILQVLSLGYLLEVAGRVARTGRLRDGFIGIRTAARVGSIMLGTWLLILPLRLLSNIWADSVLIAPDSSITTGLRIWLVVLTVLVVTHIVWAWLRGGRIRHFLWPSPLGFVRRVRRGGVLGEARDRLWDFAESLRLPYYFWLGLRGLVGALAWLAVPISLLAIATRFEGPAAGVVGFAGGLMLAVVLLYLPFLQVHFARENRFRAMFEVARVRRMFARAPIAFWFALLVTLAFAIPLYLLKIEVTPREVVWLPSLVFIVFAFPARLLAGWAVGRAHRRERPRHFVPRWAARLAALPIVVVYSLIVYLTQYVSWYGAWSLYEQHAFLVPVPFLSL